VAARVDIAEVYAAHSRAAWALAYARTLRADVASEVMQEAFLRFCKACEDDANAVQNPRAWLMRVTRNLAEDYAKSSFTRHGTQAPEALGGVRSKELSPPAILMKQEELAELKKHLQALSVDDRDILVLRYMMDFETDQLAAVFEITPAAVHMRLSRARERLAERWSGHDAE
jgi:RNA polymerase sigma-70 factor, ECF subfamily